MRGFGGLGLFIAVVVLAGCAAGDAVAAAAQTTTFLGSIGGIATEPRFINDADQVAGDWSGAPANFRRGFFWSPKHGIVDIGTLGGIGGGTTCPYAMNGSGEVVGVTSTPVYNFKCSGHAFAWTQSGGIRDLGTLGGSHSLARGINDFGEIVGFAWTHDDIASHAFAWTPNGGMVDLGTLPDFDSSAAIAVSDLGQVVGSSGSHAFYWTPAVGMVDLGTLGGDQTIANGINRLGQVFGISRTALGYDHPFVWTQTGGMTDLGTLPGGTEAYAAAESDAGQIVGWSQTKDPGVGHAFSWTRDGGMIDLGTLGGDYSAAAEVNNFGQVVGQSTTSDGMLHAFSWTRRSGIVQLDEGLETDSGTFATALNDLGDIVGQTETKAYEGHPSLAVQWYYPWYL
jgi:probable HAF family extracellular repeat protein